MRDSIAEPPSESPDKDRLDNERKNQ